MELKCSVENINGTCFPNLELKKLRQVIFLSENRKEIKIYSTMIIAGNNESCDEDKPIVSRLDDSLKLRVGFSVTEDNDNAKPKKQKHEEFINTFYKEIDKIQPIWGNDCKEIRDQEEVENQLKRILGDDGSIINKSTAIDKNYCVIEDNDHKDVILAYPGEIKTEDDAYIIGLNRALNEGMDCIVCVKTTIFLSQRMSPKAKINMRFCLPNNVILSYISIYICPPEGYHLGNDSKVNAWLNEARINDNDDQFNNLSEVAPKENIYYREWIKNEHIMSRTIYRLSREKLFRNQGRRVKNCREITIEFHMNPVMEKSSPQFVLGALFSAAVTYGVDSGRLSAVSKGFVPYIPEDLQWLLFCFIVFWVFIRWCSRKYNINNEDKTDKIINGFSLGCLIAGIAVGALWMVMTFAVSRTEIDLIAPLLTKYWILAPWMLGGSVIFLCVYIGFSYTLTRKNYGRKPVSRELFY